MNVIGLGPAASLPVPLPPSTVTATVASTVSATSAPSSPAATPAGEVRVPGTRSDHGHPADKDTTAKRREEAPKPKPLPPLKTLTVAEFRAMLGVVPLPRPTENSPTGTASNARLQPAGFDRYV